MAKEEGIRLTGRVIECLPSAMFKIKLDTGPQVLGHISGKIRQHEITILLGDMVDLEFSPYDLSKGRIIRRH